jgi:predicted metal-dependent hydrolase
LATSTPIVVTKLFLVSPLSRRIPKKPLSSIDLAALSPFELTPDDEDHLERGISLFNSGKFWEAHEVWEQIWLNHPEDGRFFIQGLIQLAAAYHQLGKKVYRGVVIHLKQAQERLKLFPSDFLGIDVSPILEVIDDSLAGIESRASLVEVDWAALEVTRIQRR